MVLKRDPPPLNWIKTSGIIFGQMPFFLSGLRRKINKTKFTFFRNFPRMWHKRLFPSKQIASSRPLPNIFATWAYSEKYRMKSL